MKRLTIRLALFFLLLAPIAAFAQNAGTLHQRYAAAADIALTAQAASIGTTNIVTSAPAGIYNVCWVQQITRAASVSSSLLTTIGWSNGSAKTTTLFSMNGGALQLVGDVSNALNSTGGNCIMIFSADGQPITYSTTYISAGGTTMQYGLFITVERYQ